MTNIPTLTYCNCYNFADKRSLSPHIPDGNKLLRSSPIPERTCLHKALTPPPRKGLRRKSRQGEAYGYTLDHEDAHANFPCEIFSTLVTQSSY